MNYHGYTLAYQSHQIERPVWQCIVNCMLATKLFCVYPPKTQAAYIEVPSTDYIDKHLINKFYILEHCSENLSLCNYNNMPLIYCYYLACWIGRLRQDGYNMDMSPTALTIIGPASMDNNMFHSETMVGSCVVYPCCCSVSTVYTLI